MRDYSGYALLAIALCLWLGGLVATGRVKR